MNVVRIEDPIITIIMFTSCFITAITMKLNNLLANLR